jgi:hypothetical protein
MSTNDAQLISEQAFAIIHVMGPHANMTTDDILNYKTEDITKRGAPYTFWTQHSWAAKPQYVRALCERGNVDLYLIARPKKRYPYYVESGVQTETDHIAATHYSADDGEPKVWSDISSLNLGPVMDNPISLRAKRSYALVLDKIERLAPPVPISLVDWADVGFGEIRPIKFRQGAHVVCAERRNMMDFPQMKSHDRVIIAKARLESPYAVWLRAD